jgi:hypothetical protein
MARWSCRDQLRLRHRAAKVRYRGSACMQYTEGQPVCNIQRVSLYAIYRGSAYIQYLGQPACNIQRVSQYASPSTSRMLFSVLLSQRSWSSPLLSQPLSLSLSHIVLLLLSGSGSTFSLPPSFHLAIWQELAQSSHMMITQKAPSHMMITQKVPPSGHAALECTSDTPPACSS